MKSLPILPALVALLSACVHSVDVRTLVKPEYEARDILFHDAAVFTALSPSLLEHHDVRVHEGRIISVSPTQAAPADVKVIECAGKTLMPGMVDVHGHPTGTGSPFYWLELPKPEHNLEAHLYAGVTTVYAPGGDPEALKALQTKVDRNVIAGPRFFYAGRMIGHAGGYPVSMINELLPPILRGIAADEFVAQVHNAAEARAAAEANLKAGASFLKVAITQLPDASAPRLTADEIRAVTDVAHAAHVLVVAHVDSAEDAELALNAGVDALWHNVQLDALTPEQVNAFRKFKAVAPTVHTFDVFEQFDDSSFKARRLVRETESEGVIQAIKDADLHKKDMPPSLMTWLKNLKAHHADRIANVKKLHDAGITLLVGTDANGSDGSFPAQMQEELLALRDAGIAPAEILLGATSRAAAFLFGDQADFGSIAVGKRADLIVVEGNPLADLEVMNQLSVVMANGRLMTRIPPTKAEPRPYY